MKKWILPALCFYMLQGCVKETVFTPSGELPAVLVVNAVITDEMKTQQVFLSTPARQMNGIPPAFSGASVLISNEDSSWHLREDPALPGCYLTPPWFVARQQRNYTLVIARGDSVWSAKSAILPGKPFTELRYRKDNASGLYCIDQVADAFNSTEAAMWEILIDWSSVAGYEGRDSLATHARLIYYTLPTLDVSEVFAPVMQTTWFPAGSVITERRYTLTPEHAAFFREVLLETNWTGGLFPIAPANVSTNMSSGAIGFFGACGVFEISLTVQ